MRSPRCCCRSPPRPRSRSVVAGRGRTGGRRQRRRAHNRPPMLPRPLPTGFWERSNLLGNMGGLRDVLGDHGITLSLQETSEYLYNTSGGTHRGGAYQPRNSVSTSTRARRSACRAARSTCRRCRFTAPTSRSASADAADRNRHRGEFDHAPVGVPAVAARRQGRREGRPAERRPGIHGEPERGDVHERDVRLARAAVDRPAGRRPRVSAVVARRAAAREAVRCVDRDGRRIRRQPGRPQRRRCAGAERARHQLQPAQRCIRDRRSAVRAERAARRPEGAATGRPAGHASSASGISRSMRTTRATAPMACRSRIRRATGLPPPIAATTGSMRSRTRWCGGRRPTARARSACSRA